MNLQVSLSVGLRSCDTGALLRFLFTVSQRSLVNTDVVEEVTRQSTYPSILQLS